MSALRRALVRALAVVLLTFGLGAVATAPAGAATLSTTQVQWNLAGLGYLSYADIDGANGPKTQGAVKAFQVDQCMDADGAAGPRTGDRLVAQVQAVQNVVGAYPADGLNGSNTKQKIIDWQNSHGLAPGDGMAGPATFAAMGLSRKRPCGGPIVGSIYDPSSTVSCYSGTTDLGVHTAYSQGTAISARLCAIPGLPSSSSESTPGSTYYVSGANGLAVVNSRVSGAMLGIVKAAQNSGIMLGASSTFRTMRHQQDLCNADSLCRNGTYTYVARPGYSNHQLGVAIDFTGTHVKGSASCTSGRAVDYGSATWNYLERNARRFGFKQYAAESWHWDAMNASTRC